MPSDQVRRRRSTTKARIAATAAIASTPDEASISGTLVTGRGRHHDDTLCARLGNAERAKAGTESPTILRIRDMGTSPSSEEPWTNFAPKARRRQDSAMLPDRFMSCSGRIGLLFRECRQNMSKFGRRPRAGRPLPRPTCRERDSCLTDSAFPLPGLTSPRASVNRTAAGLFVGAEWMKEADAP